MFSGGYQIDDYRGDKADDTADDPADKSDGPRFGQKHDAHVGDVAAQSLHNADLTGALGDGHDHGVGDAQGGHEQGDGPQAAQHHLLLPGLLLHGLADALHGLGGISHGLDLLLDVGHPVDGAHLHQHGVVGELLFGGSLHLVQQFAQVGQAHNHAL